MLKWMKKRCRRRSALSSVGGMKCEGEITHDEQRLPPSPIYFALEVNGVNSVSDVGQDMDDHIYEDVSDVTVISNTENGSQDNNCPICRSDVVHGETCSCLGQESISYTHPSNSAYFQIYADPIYNRNCNGKPDSTSNDDSSGYYESFASDSDSCDKQISSYNDSQNDVGHTIVDEVDDGYEEFDFKPGAITNKRRYSLSSPPLTSSPKFILSLIRERRLSRTISRKGSLF
ncbi:hypothetical protein SNE40_015919 [Patella caerulea]|uniref:Uncharacterized protein n=1 Tax=Patella caerulea TaxID=87958 RepID=A0AAN8JCT6_PATCE